MQGGEHHEHIPGIGRGAEPIARLRHEELPRGARAPFPSEAARALADDLARNVEGEVRFDAGSRALYATDGSNYRQVPIGVVVPRSVEELPEILAACRRHGAPVLARGGGTSLAGQCCNVAVVIDFTKFCHRLLSLDPVARTAWVEPGLVLDDLRDAAEVHRLTFGPDPSTHTHCTLGGMIGNNSCGVHSVMAGRTADNVEVGECRREKGGVMCPSYRVTREEEQSTRGRAHLLFEMLQGDPLRGGWRDEHVKGALDLCLACKGCKTDCPMNVDMATYKAEFLAHYYEGRLRPRHAYAMGLVMDWARLASLAPRLVNAATHAPGLGRLAKLAGGFAPAREVPRFAPYTFRRWYAARRPAARAAPRGRVVLFVDTFNDHFHPGTAIATLEALEAAGYAVEVPARRVCCGRPLYDFGMLRRARRQLEELLDVLAPRVDAGLRVVGIEPSCVAVLRDELIDLLADDPRAKRVAAATLMLSELFERDEVPVPHLAAKAVMQGHCHHHAVMGLDAELSVLKRIGLDVERPDSGCCGMAGSFGFERGAPYEVSRAAGERGLLPAVRAAPKDALVLADGFSCREQIAQGTDRRGLHLAEVLRLARAGGAGGAYPERRAAGDLPPLPLRARVVRGVAKGAIALALVALGAGAARHQAERASRRWNGRTR